MNEMGNDFASRGFFASWLTGGGGDDRGETLMSAIQKSAR